MSQRHTVALETAIAFVKRLSDAGPGARLPTLARMSCDADVSVRTMHKAVRILAAEGVVEARPKAGVRVVRAAPEPSRPFRTVPAAREARWRLLATELERAILLGTVGDPLPSAKELRAAYRTSHAAVSRALAALARDGRVVRRARQWRVALRVSHRVGARVLLVAPSVSLADYAGFDSKAAEFCVSLERECSRKKVTIDFRSAFAPIRPDDSALGSLVVASHDLATMSSVLAALEEAKRPVIVVDVLGDTRAPGLSRAAGTLLVQPTGACESARQIAMRLRELGHRRVAFISPYSEGNLGWVHQRLEGVRDVYGGDVAECLGPDMYSVDDARRFVSRHVVPEIEPSVGHIADVLDTYMGEAAEGWVSQTLADPMVHRLLEHRLTGVYRRALAMQDITAWVCANDEVGLSALRFLKDVRVAVPRRLCVVGFDNSPAAVLLGLSSFDYAAAAVARTALEVVLAPECSSGASSTGEIEVPGVFVERITTGRAPVG